MGRVCVKLFTFVTVEQLLHSLLMLLFAFQKNKFKLFNGQPEETGF